MLHTPIPLHPFPLSYLLAHTLLLQAAIAQEDIWRSGSTPKHAAFDYLHTELSNVKIVMPPTASITDKAFILAIQRGTMTNSLIMVPTPVAPEDAPDVLLNYQDPASKAAAAAAAGGPLGMGRQRAGTGGAAGPVVGTGPAPGAHTPYAMVDSPLERITLRGWVVDAALLQPPDALAPPAPGVNGPVMPVAPAGVNAPVKPLGDPYLTHILDLSDPLLEEWRPQLGAVRHTLDSLSKQQAGTPLSTTAAGPSPVTQHSTPGSCIPPLQTQVIKGGAIDLNNDSVIGAVYRKLCPIQSTIDITFKNGLGFTAGVNQISALQGFVQLNMKEPSQLLHLQPELLGDTSLAINLQAAELRLQACEYFTAGHQPHFFGRAYPSDLGWMPYGRVPPSALAQIDLLSDTLGPNVTQVYKLGIDAQQEGAGGASAGLIGSANVLFPTAHSALSFETADAAAAVMDLQDLLQREQREQKQAQQHPSLEALAEQVDCPTLLLAAQRLAQHLSRVSASTQQGQLAAEGATAGAGQEDATAGQPLAVRNQALARTAVSATALDNSSIAGCCTVLATALDVAVSKAAELERDSLDVQEINDRMTGVLQRYVTEKIQLQSRVAELSAELKALRQASAHQALLAPARPARPVTASDVLAAKAYKREAKRQRRANAQSAATSTIGAGSAAADAVTLPVPVPTNGASAAGAASDSLRLRPAAGARAAPQQQGAAPLTAVQPEHAAVPIPRRKLWQLPAPVRRWLQRNSPYIALLIVVLAMGLGALLKRR